MSQPLLDRPPIATTQAAPAAPAGGAGRPGPWQLVAQLLKFGVVGGLGFVWDAATVYGLRPLIGLTAAAIAAYLVAATMNWLLNRAWTFRGQGDDKPPLRQWLEFLAANIPGFAINRCVVFTLFWLSPLCFAVPILALAPGSLAGMVANFLLSRHMVFRAPPGS